MERLQALEFRLAPEGPQPLVRAHAALPEVRPGPLLWPPVVAGSPDHPSCGRVSRPCHGADRRSPSAQGVRETFGRPQVARSGDRATTGAASVAEPLALWKVHADLPADSVARNGKIIRRRGHRPAG